MDKHIDVKWSIYDEDFKKLDVVESMSEEVICSLYPTTENIKLLEKIVDENGINGIMNISSNSGYTVRSSISRWLENN